MKFININFNYCNSNDIEICCECILIIMLNVCKVSFGNYSICFEKTYVMVLKFNFEVQF